MCAFRCCPVQAAVLLASNFGPFLVALQAKEGVMVAEREIDRVRILGPGVDAVGLSARVR